MIFNFRPFWFRLHSFFLVIVDHTDIFIRGSAKHIMLIHISFMKESSIFICHFLFFNRKVFFFFLKKGYEKRVGTLYDAHAVSFRLCT